MSKFPCNLYFCKLSLFIDTLSIFKDKYLELGMVWMNKDRYLEKNRN